MEIDVNVGDLNIEDPPEETDEEADQEPEEVEEVGRFEPEYSNGSNAAYLEELKREYESDSNANFQRMAVGFQADRNIERNLSSDDF